MCSIRRSVHRFNVRSHVGAVREAPARFSSGLLQVVEGEQRAADDEVVIAAALKIVAERLVRSTTLNSPQLTRQYFMLRFAGLEHEVFACVYLDNRARVIDCEDLFRGTIDGASVHPREVVKRALIHNAAMVILAHNHPSGAAEPSQADEGITQRLKQALALVDIRVLDHLVIGGSTAAAMGGRGPL